VPSPTNHTMSVVGSRGSVTTSLPPTASSALVPLSASVSWTWKGPATGSGSAVGACGGIDDDGDAAGEVVSSVDVPEAQPARRDSPAIAERVRARKVLVMTHLSQKRVRASG
jgi:hypothetical protein